jgi:hypothetical protein
MSGLLTTEINFWRKAAKTFKTLKVRNEVITEKVIVIKAILERMENNVLKWYGLQCMGDDRCPKRIRISSPKRRKRRGRSETTWEREVIRVIKETNLTLKDAVNRQT